MNEYTKLELTEEALQRIIDHSKAHINSTVDDVVDEKLPSAVATKMDKQNPSGTGDMHITGDYYDGTGSIVGASNKLYVVKFYTQMNGSTREFGFQDSGTRAKNIINHLFHDDIVIAVLEEYGQNTHIYFSDSIAINGYFENKAHITFDGYVDGNYMYKYILDCHGSSVEGELRKIPIERYDYSTDEKAVGTWIDGATIYESTIDLGALPNTTSKYVSTDIDASQIVKIEGFATTDPSGDDKAITIPLPFAGSGRSFVGLYAHILDTNKISIRISADVDRTAYNGFVTIQYTKPND